MKGLSLSLSLTGESFPGPELLTGSGSGANWTDNGNGSYTHTPGSSTALSWTGLSLPVGDYELTYTVSGRTAGNTTGQIATATVISYATRSTNATFTEQKTNTNAGNTIFRINPASTFDGTVSALSLKRVA